jgi:hypothetical protein
MLLVEYVQSFLDRFSFGVFAIEAGTSHRPKDLLSVPLVIVNDE